MRPRPVPLRTAFRAIRTDRSIHGIRAVRSVHRCIGTGCQMFARIGAVTCATASAGRACMVGSVAAALTVSLCSSAEAPITLTCYYAPDLARTPRTPRQRPSSGSGDKPKLKQRQSLFFFGTSDESPASPRPARSTQPSPPAAVEEEVSDTVPKLNLDLNKAREVTQSRLAAMGKRLSQVQLPSFSKSDSKEWAL